MTDAQLALLLFLASAHVGRHGQSEELQRLIKEVEGEYSEAEEALMERLAKENIDASRGKLASCSISSSVTASVTDWDAFNAFIKKTGNFQLYQRRVSDPAFREMLELKGKVDHIASLTGVNLSDESQAPEALLSLGYNPPQAKEALKVAKGDTLQEKVRSALQILGKR